MSKKPIQPQDKYVLRLPDGLRDRIKAYAEKHSRSMNAEIVHRLEESFAADEPPVHLRSGRWVLPSNVTPADMSEAIEKATRQAVSKALRQLGIAEVPFPENPEDEL